MPRLGHPASAEDALSETFKSFLEHLPTLEAEEKSLYHWLSRVAVNKATDLYRNRLRTQKALVRFEQFLVSSNSTSEDEIDLLELGRELKIILAALNERYRSAIELRFFQEKTREECAAALEVTVGNFDVLI